MSYQQEIKKLILTVIEMETDEIGDDQPFKSFPHIDSLNALDILTGLERMFKIRIPEEELRHFLTINSIIALVERLAPDVQAA